MRRAAISTLILVWALFTNASEWYVSTNGTSGSAGSVVAPWSLTHALTNASVSAGDTIYLRGGSYIGSVYNSTISGTSDNYITVRSYPGELAVVSDGHTGTLLTAMTAGATNVTISIADTTGWPESPQLCVGAELLYTVGMGGTNYTVVRGWGGTTVASHDVGSAIWPVGNIIQHSGDYVVFRDFEITSRRTTNRVTGTATRIGGGIDLLGGVGNKAVQLRVYNTGHPGIGFWEQGEAGEINGCIIWGVGEYYNDGADIRGSGIYAQNEEGMSTVKNTISFRNFTTGMKVFGETGPVKDFTYASNVVIGLPSYGSINIASGSSATSNTWMIGNVMLTSPQLSYESHSNVNQYVSGNIVLNGALAVSETTSSVYTNNVVAFPKNTANGGLPFSYTSDDFAASSLDIVWDYNTYYWGDGSGEYNWTFNTSDITSTNSAGGGNLTFSGDGTNSWKNWSGFDENSTYEVDWPTNTLLIRATRLDYDTNRYHVAIVSLGDLSSTSLNLSDYGYSVGDSYSIRDAQCYNTVVSSGRYSGGTISLPLNLTNVSDISGTLTHFTNEHSNVDSPSLFNFFVLDRTPRNSINSTTVRAGSVTTP